jgi:hypothetical protein
MAVARPIPIPAVNRPTKTPGLFAPAHAPVQAGEAAATMRFRRCTFRQVEATPIGRSLTVYQVDCMYPDRVTPLPLGDLAAAHPVCVACTNPGIFRPDAD